MTDLTEIVRLGERRIAENQRREADRVASLNAMQDRLRLLEAVADAARRCCNSTPSFVAQYRLAFALRALDTSTNPGASGEPTEGEL